MKRKRLLIGLAVALAATWGSGFWKLVPCHVVKAGLGLLSITDVARALGKPISSLRWYIVGGQIPAPSFAVKRAKYYTPDEARKIALFFRSKTRYSGPRQDVAEMRRLWLSGMGQPEIAERFGLSQGTVSRLIRGAR